MAKRVDAVQAEIVSTLRQVGASICYLHTLGKGVPDILVGWHDRNWLLELKTGNAKLTSDERLWHLAWKGQVVVVRSAAEALKAIGVEVAS